MSTFAHDQEYHRVKELAQKSFKFWSHDSSFDEVKEAKAIYVAAFIHGFYAKGAENT